MQNDPTDTPTDTDALDRQISTEFAISALTNDLTRMVEGWEALGIDPDDFVTCSVCHGIFDFVLEEGEAELLPLEGRHVCECPDEVLTA